MQRSFDRRRFIIRHITVIDGRYGNPRLEKGIGIRKFLESFFGSNMPTAPMDDECDGCGFIRFRFPKIKDIAFVLTIGNLGKGRLGTSGG